MGYFSNGSEGSEYEERLCVRCRHYREDGECCPVWMLHLLYNYEQHKKKSTAEALALFIPVGPDGENGTCVMFSPDTGFRREGPGTDAGQLRFPDPGDRPVLPRGRGLKLDGGL